MTRNYKINLPTTLGILFVLVLLLLLPTYFLVKKLENLDDYRLTISKFINKKIDGTFALGPIEWALEGRHLGVKIDSFRLRDNKDQIIADAKDVYCILKWDTLVYGLGRFHKLQAKSLELNLSRDDLGFWNFEKILKRSSKKNKYLIHRFDVENMKVKVLDEPSGKSFAYDDLTLVWQRQKGDKSFSFKISSHNGLEIDKLSKVEKSSLVNYIKASGTIAPVIFRGQKVKRWKKHRSKFNYQIHNFNLADFRALLRSSEITSGISGLVNAQGSFEKKRNEDLKVSGNLRLSDFSWLWSQLVGNKIALKDLAFSHSLSLNNKIISIDNLTLALGSSSENVKAEVTGLVNGWKTKTPKLDLKISTNEFKFYRSLRLLPSSLLSQAMRQRILKSRSSELIALDLDITGTSKNPRLEGSLKLDKFVNLQSQDQGDARDLDFAIDYDKDRINIEKFTLPVLASELDVSGWLAQDKESYDLQVNSVDLPLKNLRELLLKFFILGEGQTWLNTTYLDGLTNLDLRLSKKQKEDLKVTGKSKFGKLNLRSLRYPIDIRNAFGDITLDNNKISINSFYGYIQRNYFEMLGKIDLRAKPELDLQIASNKISFDKFIGGQIKGPNILDIFGFNPIYSAGLAKDFRLNLELKEGDLKYSANAALENLAFKQSASSPTFSNINGQFSFDNEFIKFKNLLLKSDQSEFLLDGSLEKEDQLSYEEESGKLLYKLKSFVPNLKFQARDLQGKDLFFLLKEYALKSSPERKESKLLGLDGLLDIDLQFTSDEKDNYINGSIDLKGLDVVYAQPGEVFSNINGYISFKDNQVELKDIFGNFGKSNYLITGNIETHKKSSNQSWDLLVKGDLDLGEALPFMPKLIDKYFDFYGSVPYEVSIVGNRIKSLVNTSIKFAEDDYLKFADWLVKDNSVSIEIQSKMYVTPRAIFSDDSKITFSRREKASALKSVFQVKNWHNKEELSFYTDFETMSLSKDIEKTTTEEKSNRVDLKVFAPNITTIEPFSIEFQKGNFRCVTYGRATGNQTLCDINAKDLVARKFGIGDLYVDAGHVDLLAVTDKPTQTSFSFKSGKWNTIPFQRSELDLEVVGDIAYMTNIRANVLDGEVWATCEFNNRTLDSKFRFAGQKLPAHELARGIWDFGNEIPAGRVSGVFEGTTKGLEPQEMFENMVGQSNVALKDGKLSQLKTLQKYLTAVNTLNSGFGVNNIMQTLVTYEGGKFDYIISSLDYDHGTVSTEKLLLKAPQIELQIGGSLDYIGDRLQVAGQGIIPKTSNSILQKVGIGKVNLGNVFGGDSEKKVISEENQRPFKFKMKGRIYEETEAVESLRANFQWLD